MQKSEPQGVVYRDYDGGALAASARAARTSSFEAEPPAEDDADEFFAKAVDRFAEAVERRLFELDEEDAKIRAENIELKGLLGDTLRKFAALEGKVDTLLQLLGTGDARKKLWTP